MLLKAKGKFGFSTLTPFIFYSLTAIYFASFALSKVGVEKNDKEIIMINSDLKRPQKKEGPGLEYGKITFRGQFWYCICDQYISNSYDLY